MSHSRTTYGLPSFPQAQQAQIIRANQRDTYHVASLREQVEAVLRSWLGTRWLTRWDKEIELLVKLGYYGLTAGRAVQTLGEEYTDIWPHSLVEQRWPSTRARAALILLPTLPTYLLARSASRLSGAGPRAVYLLKALPKVLEVFSEVNLAIFYLRGTYYDLVKRALRIQHVSSLPQDPHTRPPSYSVLGILIAVRLLYRLTAFMRSASGSAIKGKELARNHTRGKETYIDDQPVSSFLGPVNPEGEPARPAEEDGRTILDIPSIPSNMRAGRSCTLCLEERTDSCATECGHLFCWSCIVGWGREKAECPLCRQSLNLIRLLPIYNL